MAKILTPPKPGAAIVRGAVPPGPPAHFLLGNVPELQQNNVRYMLALTRQYGDLVKFRFLRRDTYLVNHPDFIKHILQEYNRNYTKDVFEYNLVKKLITRNGLLTNSDADSWLRQRRLAQPAFHRQRIADLGALMTSAAVNVLETWEDHAKNGQALDVRASMMALTLRIVAQALFGTDVSSVTAQISRAIDSLNVFLATSFYQPSLLIPGFPAVLRRQALTARKTLDRVVFSIINERRHQNADQGDLLSMLLLAQDEETGERMSDTQLRDEVLTLLLAGHETTAVALTWTWFLLAQHPEVSHRLHQELAEVLGGRIPTIGDLPRLAYTRMVVDETLRLYPPVWYFGRKALAADEIGGYHLPAHATFYISPYTMHRHPGFWEHPETFDPERFTPERSADRPRYAYLPFGGGPRQCIGNTFALTEAHLILATLAQHYQLRLAPGHPVEVEGLITLRPRQGMKMIVQRL
jgi:cytochrome P450